VPPLPDSPVHRYHDGTKHFFDRFARSLGYLDWASQPRPFRSYDGATIHALYPAPGSPAPARSPAPVAFDEVLARTVASQPLTAASVGDLLRHSLGLSAWKAYGTARWSLRVNPSSGNLHPTEAYVVSGPLPGLADDPGVYHYQPEHHALERRCRFEHEAWDEIARGGSHILLALTSIHWREAWKYGERAFRYCQHDLGHAIGAVSLAAAMLGWRAVVLPSCSHRNLATLVGIDREADFVEAEREEPGCVLAVVSGGVPALADDGGARVAQLVREATWWGSASQLSEDHVQWTFIDEIAEATADPGHPQRFLPAPPARPALPALFPPLALPARDFRALVLQRRSAVAFDASTSMTADAWWAMLARAMPTSSAPWDGLWWTPCIHLALFVHRVRDVRPGLYFLSREPDSGRRLLGAFGDSFLREPAHATLPLTCLAVGDCRALARRLSCDQDIASDGCFSLGMIADFDRALSIHGPSFYRAMYWEAGLVGQMLYLEAEAAGLRATGIGCFYDDAVHDMLGLSGHGFQSLYHFTVGVPVEDRRLTSEPGYSWER
jgi:SagB-type dehydrogenase family enzyme